MLIYSVEKIEKIRELYKKLDRKQSSSKLKLKLIKIYSGKNIEMNKIFNIKRKLKKSKINSKKYKNNLYTLKIKKLNYIEEKQNYKRIENLENKGAKLSKYIMYNKKATSAFSIYDLLNKAFNEGRKVMLNKSKRLLKEFKNILKISQKLGYFFLKNNIKNEIKTNDLLKVIVKEKKQGQEVSKTLEFLKLKKEITGKTNTKEKNSNLAYTENLFNKNIPKGLIKNKASISKGMLNFEKIKKISIPQYATGGVVKKPTIALIGETVEESIIPHNNDSRSIKLWEEAGKKLGVYDIEDKKVYEHYKNIENKIKGKNIYTVYKLAENHGILQNQLISKNNKILSANKILSDYQLNASDINNMSLEDKNIVLKKIDRLMEEKNLEEKDKIKISKIINGINFSLISENHKIIEGVYSGSIETYFDNTDYFNTRNNAIGLSTKALLLLYGKEIFSGKNKNGELLTEDEEDKILHTYFQILKAYIGKIENVTIDYNLNLFKIPNKKFGGITLIKDKKINIDNSEALMAKLYILAHEINHAANSSYSSSEGDLIKDFIINSKLINKKLNTKNRRYINYRTTPDEIIAYMAGDKVKYIFEKIPKYEAGGIITKETYAIVGEAGPETIIPHKKNTRSINLWEKTGKELGVYSDTTIKSIEKYSNSKKKYEKAKKIPKFINPVLNVTSGGITSIAGVSLMATGVGIPLGLIMLSYGANSTISGALDMYNLSKANYSKIRKYNFLLQSYEYIGEKLGKKLNNPELGKNIGSFFYHGSDLLISIGGMKKASTLLKLNEARGFSKVIKLGKGAALTKKLVEPINKSYPIIPAYGIYNEVKQISILSNYKNNYSNFSDEYKNYRKRYKNKEEIEKFIKLIPEYLDSYKIDSLAESYNDIYEVMTRFLDTKSTREIPKLKELHNWLNLNKNYVPYKKLRYSEYEDEMLAYKNIENINKEYEKSLKKTKIILGYREYDIENKKLKEVEKKIREEGYNYTLNKYEKSQEILNREKKNRELDKENLKNISKKNYLTFGETFIPIDIFYKKRKAYKKLRKQIEYLIKNRDDSRGVVKDIISKKIFKQGNLKKGFKLNKGIKKFKFPKSIEDKNKQDNTVINMDLALNELNKERNTIDFNITNGKIKDREAYSKYLLYKALSKDKIKKMEKKGISSSNHGEYLNLLQSNAKYQLEVSKESKGESNNLSSIKYYAIGGVVSKPTIAILGEGSDSESIIPHNRKPRSIKLWKETGEIMGLLPKNRTLLDGLKPIEKVNKTKQNKYILEEIPRQENKKSETKLKEIIFNILESNSHRLENIVKEFVRQEKRLSYE